MPVIFWLLVNGQNRRFLRVSLRRASATPSTAFWPSAINWTSELGAYLDPLADKMLIVSIYIALAVRGEMPLWLVIAVVSRDILILAAVLLSWLLDQPVRIKPLAISKINTAGAARAGGHGARRQSLRLGLDTSRLVLVWITGALTLLSLAAYLRAWFMHMAGYESGRSGPE